MVTSTKMLNIFVRKKKYKHIRRLKGINPPGIHFAIYVPIIIN